MLPFFLPPTGLAVGLARKESRYAARGGDSPPAEWLRPVVPPFPAGMAVRELGVYVPNEARHSSEGRRSVRRIACTAGCTPSTPPPPTSIRRSRVVDLDAFDANAADLLRRAGGKPVRLASKSVRCRALPTARWAPGCRGILAFTLPEALWLAGTASTTWSSPTRPSTARRCARWRRAGARAGHADGRLPRAPRPDPGRGGAGARVPSTSTPAGGRSAAACGSAPSARRCARPSRPRRSRARSPPARARARRADDLRGADRRRRRPPPGSRCSAPRCGRCSAPRRASWRRRRAAVVAAVRAVAPLRFVNGGGTGLDRAHRGRAGGHRGRRGLGPLRPDAVRRLPRASRPRPAAFFALPVVRRPVAAASATVLGGGYPASGAAGARPPPPPRLPPGLRLDRQEGAGEVQTPLLGPAAAGLRIGDRVWFRHAKAGELCERFDVLHLVAGRPPRGRPSRPTAARAARSSEAEHARAPTRSRSGRRGRAPRARPGTPPTPGSAAPARPR